MDHALEAQAKMVRSRERGELDEALRRSRANLTTMSNQPTGLRAMAEERRQDQS